MKTDGTLMLFVLLLVTVIGFAFILGNADPITPAVMQGQAQLTLGHTATNWINSVAGWIFKLAFSGMCAGFGVAAFNELRTAYSLWKRSAQPGRWTPGPNANWQRTTSAPKLSKQDLLLLALSGRLPGPDTTGKAPVYSTTSSDSDEDKLDLRL